MGDAPDASRGENSNIDRDTGDDLPLPMRSRLNRRRLQRVNRRERNTAIALAVAGISVIGSATYLATLGSNPLEVGARSIPKAARPRVAPTTPTVPATAPQQQASTIAGTDVVATTGATSTRNRTTPAGGSTAAWSGDDSVLVCACLASLPGSPQQGGVTAPPAPTGPLAGAPGPGAAGPGSPGTGAGGTGGTRPIATTTTVAASTTTTTAPAGPVNVPGLTIPEPVRGLVGTLPLP